MTGSGTSPHAGLAFHGRPVVVGVFWSVCDQNGTCYAGFAYALWLVVVGVCGRYAPRAVFSLGCWQLLRSGVGFACGVAPRAVFLLVVSRPTIFCILAGTDQKGQFVRLVLVLMVMMHIRAVFPSSLHAQDARHHGGYGQEEQCQESLGFYRCSTWTRLMGTFMGFFMVVGWTTPFSFHRRLLFFVPSEVPLTPPQLGLCLQWLFGWTTPFALAQKILSATTGLKLPFTVPQLDEAFTAVASPQVLGCAHARLA